MTHEKDGSACSSRTMKSPFPAGNGLSSFLTERKIQAIFLCGRSLSALSRDHARQVRTICPSPLTYIPIFPVLQAAAKVRFLVLDVDGVCTDGKLYFQENGHPMKCFNSQDGIGIKTALLAGIGVGIITGRNDPCVLARMSQLGVKDYYAGFESKLPKLEAIRRKYGLAPEEMAYLGDDWIDLDPMRSVGMPMAVANAVRQVKKEALYITAARGGEGAVREAVEFLLAARMDGKNPADLWTAATGPAKV